MTCRTLAPQYAKRTIQYAKEAASASGRAIAEALGLRRFNLARINALRLKRLEAEGLVALDELGTSVVSHFGSEDIEEIYGLRLLLEPYAAGKALDCITAGDLEELENITHEMKEAAALKDIDRYVQLNQTFHLSLYELSRQRRLVRMIQSLWLGLMPLTPMAVPGQLERSASEHEAILRALQERQRDTLEALMRDHIQHAALALQTHLGIEEETVT